MFTEINPAPNRERQTVQIPRRESMPAGGYLKFRNDRGVPEIGIGVREFKCISEDLIGQTVLEVSAGVAVVRGQAAMSFSFARGSASRKVCIGVLPKHQRP